ncbi:MULTISPECIES: PepSY domain-containing protein [Chitinibacter]|uniref:PepSY domain-containing protein n=1 Tax=Chitinibacter TaxID=230666 RepID=UPI000412EA8B|nr:MULTISPECIES: PepSY domain-containing protein [Chitinibacter]
MLKYTALALVTAVFAGQAMAAAKCTAHPKAEWMPEAQVKAKLAEQGYTIKKFKVDGNCYEMYGKTKDGKKAEIYFDTKTMDVVKSEIE